MQQAIFMHYFLQQYGRLPATLQLMNRVEGGFQLGFAGATLPLHSHF